MRSAPATYQPQFNPAPRRNPITTAAVLGTIGGLTLVGGALFAAHKMVQDAQKAKDAEKPKEEEEPSLSPFSGVYAQGATVSASGHVFAPPIAISMYDIATGDGEGAPTTANYPYMTRAETLVVRTADGELVPLEYFVAKADGTMYLKIDEEAVAAAGIDPSLVKVELPKGSVEERIGRLVTDLAGLAAKTAYYAAVERITKHNDNLAEPSGTRDAYVRGVLSNLVKSVDWSGAPESLRVGTVAWEVWMGVDLMGQLAYQQQRQAKNGGGGSPDEQAMAAEAEGLRSIVDKGLLMLANDRDIQQPAQQVSQGQGYGGERSPGALLVYKMKILEDQMTKSTGQYVGLMSYASSDGTNGSFVLRGSTAAKIPDTFERRNELMTKFASIAQAKYKELYG